MRFVRSFLSLFLAAALALPPAYAAGPAGYNGPFMQFIPQVPSSVPNGSTFLDSTNGNAFSMKAGGTVTPIASTNNPHQSVVFLSTHGADSPNCGTFASPCLTPDKANIQAAALSPSASNIVTIYVDPGYYPAQPGFTFLDFGNYFSPGPYQSGIYIPGHYFTVSSANATAGAMYTDGTFDFAVAITASGSTNLQTTGPHAPGASSGVLMKVSGIGDDTIAYSAESENLPITMNPVMGSRIWITGILTGTSSATLAGSDVIYADLNLTSVTQEVLTWTLGEIVGSLSISGIGTTNTSFSMNDNSFQFGAGSKVSVTNATLAFNQSGFFPDSSVISQTNSAYQSQISILGGSIFTGLITLNGVGGGNIAQLTLSNSGGFLPAITLNDPNSAIVYDADSYGIVSGATYTFNGGSGPGQIQGQTTGSAIVNNSNLPGSNVTEVFNNLQSYAHAATLYVDQNGSDAAGCGGFLFPCQTVSYAYSTLPGGHGFTIIAISGRITESAPFNAVDWTNFVVEGDLNQSPSWTTSDGSALTFTYDASASGFETAQFSGITISTSSGVVIDSTLAPAGVTVFIPFDDAAGSGVSFNGRGGAADFVNIINNSNFGGGASTIHSATLYTATGTTFGALTIDDTGYNATTGGIGFAGAGGAQITGSFFAGAFYLKSTTQPVQALVSTSDTQGQSVTLDGTQTLLTLDGVSANGLSITYLNGATKSANVALTSSSDWISNSSSVPGQSLSDALNKLWTAVSALWDFTSNTLKIPVAAPATPPSSPSPGDTIYTSGYAQLCVWVGSSWNQVNVTPTTACTF